jgi:RHS repeat-associated protein
MIAKLNTNGTFHSRKWSCVWSPDVGSSLYARSDWMAAGGIGGVAWLQTGAVQSYSYGTGSAEVHVPLADHMGNVRHYYQFKATKGKVIGQLVASYEYDAFGREVRAWGLNTPATNQPPGLPASRPWADLLPFHYSSKLRDVDSGFNYYGYRFYDPGAGRWLNRDPIGERGGLNLYGMVGNDCVNLLDSLGLLPCKDGEVKDPTCFEAAIHAFRKENLAATNKFDKATGTGAVIKPAAAGFGGGFTVGLGAAVGVGAAGGSLGTTGIVATGGWGLVAGGLAALAGGAIAIVDGMAAHEELKRDLAAAKLNFDLAVAACPCIPKHSINLACESR